MVCVKRTIRLEIVVGGTRWIPEVTLVLWNIVSVHLEIVLVSEQDRCTVCTKRTMGSEIVLDTPDGTPRDEAQVATCFGLFADSANLDAR
jgi:hypothetical protein